VNVTAAWNRLRAHRCARDLDDIRCEAGWVELLDVCFTALDALTPLPRVEVVKQKFGELRVYYSPPSKGAQAVIAAARERALAACEKCGEAGRQSRMACGVFSCPGCGRSPGGVTTRRHQESNGGEWRRGVR